VIGRDYIGRIVDGQTETCCNSALAAEVTALKEAVALKG
jgi:hypothetical protein